MEFLTVLKASSVSTYFLLFGNGNKRIKIRIAKIHELSRSHFLNL